MNRNSIRLLVCLVILGAFHAHALEWQLKETQLSQDDAAFNLSLVSAPIDGNPPMPRSISITLTKESNVIQYGKDLVFDISRKDELPAVVIEFQKWIARLRTLDSVAYYNESGTGQEKPTGAVLHTTNGDYEVFFKSVQRRHSREGTIPILLTENRTTSAELEPDALKFVIDHFPELQKQFADAVAQKARRVAEQKELQQKQTEMKQKKAEEEVVAARIASAERLQQMQEQVATARAASEEKVKQFKIEQEAEMQRAKVQKELEAIQANEMEQKKKIAEEYSRQTLSQHTSSTAALGNASVPDKIDEKLQGMSEDDAFNYGKRKAYAMFKEVRIKSAMPEVVAAFGSVTDETIRSAFPKTMASEDKQLYSDEAISQGVSSSVIRQFFNGFEAGAMDVKVGKELASAPNEHAEKPQGTLGDTATKSSWLNGTFAFASLITCGLWLFGLVAPSRLSWLMGRYATRRHSCYIFLPLFFVFVSLVGATMSDKQRAALAAKEKAEIADKANKPKKHKFSLFGSKPTKTEWRASVPNGQMLGATGQIICNKSELFAAAGKPHRTQSLGGMVFLYWECKDGTIQVACEGNTYNAGGQVIGTVNDY